MAEPKWDRILPGRVFLLLEDRGGDGLSIRVLRSSDPSDFAWLAAYVGADFVTHANPGDLVDLPTADPDMPDRIVIRMFTEWTSPRGQRRG